MDKKGVRTVTIIAIASNSLVHACDRTDADSVRCAEVLVVHFAGLVAGDPAAPDCIALPPCTRCGSRELGFPSPDDDTDQHGAWNALASVLLARRQFHPALTEQQRASAQARHERPAKRRRDLTPHYQLVKANADEVQVVLPPPFATSLSTASRHTR